MKKQSFSPFIIWSFIIVAACIFYGVGISHESFWLDEVYSAAMADHPFLKILSLTAHDNHPPLYYLLLRIFRLLLGNSEWALRLLSVFGAVAIVSLGAGPVRRIFGNTIAYIYAAVTLFTPGILIYAHEARMYSLVMFAVTASALYGYLASQNNKRSDWVCFGVSSLAAAYLHYYGLIAAFYINLFVGLWLLVKKREHLKSFLFAAGTVLVGYLPWMVVFVKQIMATKRAFWIPPVDRLAVIKAFHKPFAYKDFFPNMRPTMGIVVVFSLVLIVFGVVFAIIKKAEKELTFSLFSLLVYLSTLFTAIIVSLILTPVFFARYMIVCVGLFLLPLSLGISLLPVKILRPAAVGLFALLNVFVIKDVCTQRFNGPMQEMARSLQDAIKPGDLLITSDAFAMGPALYYFPEAAHVFYINPIESQWQHIYQVFESRLTDHENLKELFTMYRSFWIMKSNSGFSVNTWQILKEEKGWEEYIEPIDYSYPYSQFAFTVSKFVYTGNENASQRGTLRVKMTGIKPVIPSTLIVVLCDDGPLVETNPPYQVGFVEVTGEEILYTFDGVEYGDYVLLIVHDENDNHRFDKDINGIPAEGFALLNYEPSMGLNPTFDQTKFPFNEPEKEITLELHYPPFTELLQGN